MFPISKRNEHFHIKGNIIRTTADHSFLAISGCADAGDFRVGDLLLIHDSFWATAWGVDVEEQHVHELVPSTFRRGIALLGVGVHLQLA